MPASEAVVFKIDSGATNNFVNEEVPTVGDSTCNSLVEQADGSPIHVKTKGRFIGTAGDGNRDSKFAFAVKKSEAFVQNLFSVHRAARSGCRVVLDDEESYIENKKSGNRIPLVRCKTGWELRMKPQAD
mgnify:CR=1 FL=1